MDRRMPSNITITVGKHTEKVIYILIIKLNTCLVNSIAEIGQCVYSN